jgi:AcrR family transcriptional regulator
LSIYFYADISTPMEQRIMTKNEKPETRKKILGVAETLFAERGFEGVSVKDITEGADVHLGALTYHFGSKERLFAEIITVKSEPLVKMGRNILNSGKTPPEKLTALMESYAMHTLHDEPVLKALFSEMLLGGRRLPKSTTETVSLRNRMFIQVVKQGIKSGYFRKVDLESAAWNFFGMMSAYILYEPLAGTGGRRAAYPKPYVKRIVRASLDIFLAGIELRPSPKKAPTKTAKKKPAKKK